MTASFAAVALQNLLGDNSAQARLLFAPTALTLSVLCAVVALATRSMDIIIGATQPAGGNVPWPNSRFVGSGKIAQSD